MNLSTENKRKQALNLTRLLTVSAPDAFANGLAQVSFTDRLAGIAAPHLYPFGGFDRLFDWLAARGALDLSGHG